MPEPAIQAELRATVTARAHGCCEYCHSQERCQVWGEHFTWNEDYTLIVGLTPAGRATVDVLRLNRVGVVNLRRVLYRLGEHPPEARSVIDEVGGR